MGRRGHKKQKAFRRATVDAIRKARLEKQKGANGEPTTATNEDQATSEDRPRVSKYEDIVKENALFEKYY
ncbi:unnamed protein product, partial [Rotaria magnacalcarata]